MNLIDFLILPDVAGDMQFVGSTACVANYSAGLRLLDVSFPNAIETIGSFNTNGTATAISTTANHAFLADGQEGMRIFDVSDATNPSEIGLWDSGIVISSVYAEGNTAVAIGNIALQLLDISDIENPVPRGSLDLSVEFNRRGDVQGDLAFVASGSGGLFIIDIAVIDSPSVISNIETDHRTEDVVVDQQIAYVADGSGGLLILDVSNPEAPVELSRYTTPGSIRRLHKYGDFIYSCVSNMWFLVIDVSDINNPVLAGRYPVLGSGGGGGWYLAPFDNYCIGAAGSYLFVFDVSAALSTPNPRTSLPAQFSLHPIYPNPFNNTANITFDLPREVTGRLVVYDVLGRMANTLYDGRLTAGSHTMQFSGDNLSSGTYFVKLETPDFNAVQKAVLLK